MRRTYKRDAFTDEELANLKDGKCWCGEERIKFAKGMRVYCSPEHRSIWYAKTLTWQEFRDKFLRLHGEKCDACGKDNGQEEYRLTKIKQRDFFENIKPAIIDKIIAKNLADLEERYERDFKNTIDPDSIREWDIENYCKSHRINYPDPDKQRPDYSISFEVDHKLAIVNGGAEFDENNLQVLCTDCHKKKTKADLKKNDTIPVNLTDAETPISIEKFGNGD